MCSDLSGRAGVEVFIAESQNPSSMPCQFGIETVVVVWDPGELESDTASCNHQRLRSPPFLTISFRTSGAPFTVTRWVWPEDWAGTKALMTDILFREEEKWKRWTIFRVAFLPFLEVTASPVIEPLWYGITWIGYMESRK